MTDLLTAPSRGVPATTDLIGITDGTGGIGWNSVTIALLRRGLDWAFRPPLAADFPTLASADATNVILADDNDTGLFIDGQTSGSTDDIRGAFKALPAAGNDWTATVHIIPANDGSGAKNGTGIIIRESGTNKIAIFGPLYGKQIDGYRGTITAYTAGIVTDPHGAPQPWWFRIAYNNAANTYTFLASPDGKRWIAQSAAIAAATIFTTRADQIGLGVTMNTAGRRPTLVVDYWAQSW